MKILVIEDELATIKGSFDLANSYAFEDNLQVTYIAKSQDIDFQSLSQYIVIFIDISLANNSKMDGFNIIKKIHEEQVSLLNRIVILTGNNKIEESLKDQDIDFRTIKIVYKPASFMMIASIIQEKIPQ